MTLKQLQDHPWLDIQIVQRANQLLENQTGTGSYTILKIDEVAEKSPQQQL
jgi:hypothetical protein